MSDEELDDTFFGVTVTTDDPITKARKRKLDVWSGGDISREINGAFLRRDHEDLAVACVCCVVVVVVVVDISERMGHRNVLGLFWRLLGVWAGAWTAGLCERK